MLGVVEKLIKEHLMIYRFAAPNLPALDVEACDTVEAKARATAALRLTPGSGYWDDMSWRMAPPPGVDVEFVWASFAPPSISSSPVATVGS